MTGTKGQPDPHELAVARGRAGAGPYEPLPALLRRGDLRKVLLLVVVGLVALAALKAGGGGRTPSAPGSCTRPAFAFDRDEVRSGRLVAWSVSAPSGDDVVVTADSAVATRGRLAGPVRVEDCRASGRFLVRLPEGEHVLRVLLLRSDGSTKQLGSRTLTVDAR